MSWLRRTVSQGQTARRRGLSKAFRQRIRIKGEHVDLEIGRFPDIGLSEAREITTTNLHDVEAGRDPCE